MKKEIEKQHLIDMMRDDENLGLYKEEKQETTLEEKAEEYEYTDGIYGFKAGAKWQAKRMYSEEEVYNLLVEWTAYQNGFPRVDEDEIPNGFMSFNQWFEQFKKK